MYKLTAHNNILRVIDGAHIPFDPANADYATYLDWLAAGNTPEPYIEPAEQTRARLTNAVQAHLDAKAKVRGYDNIVSACSYAAAANAFQTEGLAYLAWRADVWSSCYTLLAAVQQGQIAVPTEAELIAQLPAPPFPDQEPLLP